MGEFGGVEAGKQLRRAERRRENVNGRVLVSVAALCLASCSDPASTSDTPPPEADEVANDQRVASVPPAIDDVGTSSEADAGVNNTDFLLDGLDDSMAQAPEPPVEGPSCDGMPATTCGLESCCGRESVTTGETLMHGRELQLSPYALDTYEVTVGRFRRFVRAYDEWRGDGNPVAGAGAHPSIVGSGWNADPVWDGTLAPSAVVLRLNLNCDESEVWTNSEGPHEALPMNCLSWYEAFAFCAWDGGRIQTELEWQYAASGGGQSRLFPWGNVPPAENFAVYGCLASGSSACEAGDVVPVGSRPDGRGRFGHQDLSGSVFEWALDWSAPLPDAFGDNYAKVNAGEQRVLKGGGWLDSRLEFLETTNRTVRLPPGSRTSNTGVRCAHDPEPQLR